MRNNDFLAKEPIGKLLFKLAIPTLTAQLINLLYNLVDKIYIGHLAGEGELALAGLGICTPLIMIVSAFAALVASGGAPRASIAMGSGERERAETILGSCAAFQVVISLILTVLLLALNSRLLMLFGGSPNTIGYAVGYMNIYSLGTLFVQLTLGLNAFITAQGFTKESMITVLIGAGLNILLDPLFIFVFGMGVQGAALATVLSQMISCLRVLRFLTGEKSLLRLQRDRLHLRREVLLPCLALGIAPFIMQSSESFINICFNSSLQKFGGDIAVGSMTVLASSMMLVFMPMQGFSQGAQPILSYNYGAGKADRVKKTYFLLLLCCLAYSTMMWLVIMLAPQGFVRLFTPEEELIHYASRALRIYGAVVCLIGIQIACQMTLVSLGNAKTSAIVAIVRKFVLLFPLVYLIPCFVEEKAVGVFLAEPVADFLAVCFTATIFTLQFRKALREMKNRLPS